MERRIIAGIIGLVVLVAVVFGVRHMMAENERLKADLKVSQHQAKLSDLEAQGERQSAQRVDVVVRQQAAVERTVSDFTQQARSSEDANAPLSEDRASRLAAHDDELCRIDPSLEGCAPTDHAGDRD